VQGNWQRSKGLLSAAQSLSLKVWRISDENQTLLHLCLLLRACKYAGYKKQWQQQQQQQDQPEVVDKDGKRQECRTEFET
jgi:hypothetical protein